jgi:hypothetical protein
LVRRWSVLLKCLILSSLLILSSCGDNGLFVKPQEATAPPLSVQLIEQGCDNAQERSVAASQVQELLKEYEDFSNNHNEKAQARVMRLGQFADEFKSSHRRPHIMSEKIIKEKIDKIRRELRDHQGKAIIDVEGVNELAHEMVRLKNIAARWQAQQCALKSLKGGRKNDFRFFLNIKEKRELSIACLEKFSDKCDRVIIDEFKKNKGRQLILLCARHHSFALCSGELRNAWGNDRAELKYFRYYYNLSDKRYQKFFSIDRQRSFKCSKEVDGNKVLHLAVFGLNDLTKKLGITVMKLNSYVNEQWGYKGFVIKLSNSEPDQSSFSLLFHQKFISQVVEETKPVMMLANHLQGQELVKIFNHELGHILGFPDCYVEYYNKKKGELIYYTLQLDQENIMCEISPAAKVPDSYKDQLVQKHCL